VATEVTGGWRVRRSGGRLRAEPPPGGPSGGPPGGPSGGPSGGSATPSY
jgi:hypothetical protein